MKTAISIPDPIFASAEDLAQRLGISRSELYVNALREYLQHHFGDGITERVNAVCEKIDTSLDKPLLRAQKTLLPDENW